MKTILIKIVACATYFVWAESSMSTEKAGDVCGTNNLHNLRKVYPFFDGIPPDIPEEDIRRTDEWETGPYNITKHSASDELVLLSKPDITQNRLNARPYSSIGCVLGYTTLGQLSKQCDGVFIGIMSNVKSEDISDKPDHRKGEAFFAKIKFQVETNLFGQISGDTVTIPMTWIDGKAQMPSEGLRMLVFYARGHKINFFDRAVRKFDWIKPQVESNEPPAMLFRDWNTSMRVLKTPEIEKAYIQTVNGYLQIFRKGKRSPIEYYAFLKPLVKSPIWHIRQDAREDMLSLLRHEGTDMFDLKLALDDPELMDFFKDYIRYIVIPAREKRMKEKL